MKVVNSRRVENLGRTLQCGQENSLGIFETS